MEEYKIYDMDIDEYSINDDNVGVNAVSLVVSPAIESNFVALSKEEESEVMLSYDADKQIVTGALLIPNKLIFRKRDNGEMYYQRYPPETILKVARRMMRQGDKVIKNTTLEHNVQLQGNYLSELWIVEDPNSDKSKALGINVPKGTLMASYKIEDRDLWKNEIKSGHLRGFSIEGKFFENEAPLMTEEERTRIRTNIYDNNKKNIDMNKKTLFDKISALFNDTEDTELSAVELTEELKKSQETVVALTAEKEEVRVQLDLKDDKIAELEAQVEELKAKLSEKETSDKEKDEKLTALEAQVTELSKQPSQEPVNVNNSKVNDKPLAGHQKMAAALADILK